MTETCERAARSIRVCAWINIKKAKQARDAGRPRMAAYHLNVAKVCRRDSNSLKSASPA